MRLIDRFIPDPDARDLHSIDVRAPASLVFEVATTIDMQSLPLVRALIWTRGKVMRARRARRTATALLDELQSIGWRVLARAGEEIVLGCVAQPWVADVVFRGLSPDAFADFRQPGFVKIAVDLDAEPLGPTRTRLSTETRVKATDVMALVKFRRYWRATVPGIVLIRLALLRAVRREAEARYHAQLRELGQAA